MKARKAACLLIRGSQVRILPGALLRRRGRPQGNAWVPRVEKDGLGGSRGLRGERVTQQRAALGSPLEEQIERSPTERHRNSGLGLPLDVESVRIVCLEPGPVFATKEKANDSEPLGCRYPSTFGASSQAGSPDSVNSPSGVPFRVGLDGSRKIGA
jgi:hypothetical protein